MSLRYGIDLVHTPSHREARLDPQRQEPGPVEGGSPHSTLTIDTRLRSLKGRFTAMHLLAATTGSGQDHEPQVSALLTIMTQMAQLAQHLPPPTWQNITPWLGPDSLLNWSSHLLACKARPD